MDRRFVSPVANSIWESCHTASCKIREKLADMDKETREVMDETLLGGIHRFDEMLRNEGVRTRMNNWHSHTSKQHFAEANLLGMDFLRKLELAIVPDWRNDTFQLIRI
ncbi:unnamed protein product [Auanema sp. JU1783]|nr:unnamed protein product [Auanema sp. JU1783]